MAAVGTETFTGTLTVTLDDSALAVAGTVTTGNLPRDITLLAGPVVTRYTVGPVVGAYTVGPSVTGDQVTAGPTLTRYTTGPDVHAYTAGPVAD
jgi:hypothetical protein